MAWVDIDRQDIATQGEDHEADLLGEGRRSWRSAAREARQMRHHKTALVFEFQRLSGQAEFRGYLVVGERRWLAVVQPLCCCWHPA